MIHAFFDAQHVQVVTGSQSHPASSHLKSVGKRYEDPWDPAENQAGSVLQTKSQGIPRFPHVFFGGGIQLRMIYRMESNDSFFQNHWGPSFITSETHSYLGSIPFSQVIGPLGYVYLMTFERCHLEKKR